MVGYGLLFLSISLIIRYFIRHADQLKLLNYITLGDKIALLCVYLFIHQLSAYKIFLILRHLQLKNIRFFSWFKIFTVSRFVNLYITQGANIYRSIKLKMEYAFSYTKSLSLIAVFTWFESLIIFCLLLLITLKNDPHKTIGKIAAPFLIFLIIITTIFLPIFLKNALKKISFKNKSLQWAYGRLDEMLRHTTEAIKDIHLVTSFLAVSVITFSFYLVLTAIGFHALNTPMNLVSLAFFTSILLLSRTFNIIPGNLGLQELACGYLGPAIGWDVGSGIMVSGMIRLAEYIVVTLLGMIFAKTLFIHMDAKK